MDGWTGGDGCVVVMMHELCGRQHPTVFGKNWPWAGPVPQENRRRERSLTLLECQMRCRLASLLCSRA